MSDKTEIWCDGSYRQAHKTAGAGWVIRHPDGREEECALRLPQIRNSSAYGSQIAEFLAAAYALNAVIAPGSVIVHMDCLLALQALEQNKAPAYKQQNLPSLQAAFRTAYNATTRFENITLILSSDRTDHRMSRAHQLSRTASVAVA